MIFKRRTEDDTSNDDMIKQLMANGSSTKYLVAKMYIEFREHFIKLNGKVNFHDKFIWTFIGILITGFVGGVIVIILRSMGG